MNDYFPKKMNLSPGQIYLNVFLYMYVIIFPPFANNLTDNVNDLIIFLALTPLEYLKDNVHITSSRKLLYNCIFNQYKMDKDDDIDYERRVSGKSLESCLNLVMGKTLTNQQLNHFRRLVDWKETDTFEFKTSCGIYALCERILAPQICLHLPDRKADPCHEIEKADFQLLDKKLEGRQVNENLKSILLNIKEL